MTERETDGKFKKGASGNPGGRPKDALSARAVAKEVLEAVCELKNKDDTLRYPDKSKLEALFERLWEVAMAKNDMRAAKLLLEYGYGPPPQTIEHEGLPGTEGRPLVIIMGNGKKTEVKPGAESE